MNAGTSVIGAFGLAAEVFKLTDTTARATVIPPHRWPYLRGHLPGLPGVPGMALADLIPRIGVSVGLCHRSASELVLARFSSPLMPGERLHLEVEFDPRSSQLRARGTINDQRDLGEIIWSYAEADRA